MKKKSSFAGLMLLLASMMWGGSYAIQNIMSEHIGSFSIVFIKTFTGYLLIIYCLLRKKKFNKEVIIGGVLVGISTGAGLIFQQFGLITSSVSNVSFISALYIMFVPIYRLVEKKKPKNKFWLSVFVACVGLYLLCINDSFTIVIGDIFTLVSAALFGLQIICIDKYAPHVDTTVLCGIQQTVTATICLIIMLFTEDFSIASLKGIEIPVLYVMFISGLVASLIQSRYQSYIDPTIASLLMSLEAVFGALGGVLILGDVLSVREIIGCGLLFFAITMAD